MKWTIAHENHAVDYCASSERFASIYGYVSAIQVHLWYRRITPIKGRERLSAPNQAGNEDLLHA